MSQVIHVQCDNTWMYWTNPARMPGTQEGIQRWDQLRGASMEGFELNLPRSLGVGRRLWNAQPLDDWFQFPLTDGKIYKVRRDWSDGEGYNEYTAKVGPLIRLAVGAGTFSAREVIYKGWWYRTSGNTASGRVEVSEYWSPELARVIKSSFRDWTPRSSLWNHYTWELVRWEPQAELVFKPARQAPCARFTQHEQ